MAIKVTNYELPDKTTLPEAYIRIQNIVTENRDFELLEPIDNTPNADLKTTWVTRFINTARVYVWADELCRQNRVSPLHWFAIDFDYDPKCDPNVDGDIYEAAYNALKRKYEKYEDC